MKDELNRLKELRTEASALIGKRTPEALKRAKTLVTHQQLLMRELIDASKDYLSVAEIAEMEALFLKAQEKLQKK